MPTCAWCMQPDYLSADGSPLPRCNQEELFQSAIKRESRSQCAAQYVVNPMNMYTILKNLQLNKGQEYKEAVQVKPQHVQLKLRTNEAYDLDFYYEQAEDYPVDLYYLMDLSKSMEDDKEKLSALGDRLSATMQSITSNFRLGFGSFVDKVVMPYVSTVPRKLEEPCEGCAAPYGFKHHMSLSSDTRTFANEVKKAKVSGNLDAPEGGFDAIMQAVVCKDIIGWRDKARRLLVFSTDAGFHYAGDGKLGGIVTPNDGLCHMDSKGVYTHSTIQDYPSVSQINHKVKENSVNLIFAVTDEQLHIYNLLAGAVEGSTAGRLSADSSNVVELVRAQYEAITSTIEMKDNSTGNVRVTYFSSCIGDGPPRQTNKCSGLKVGTRVMFTAKIEVVKCPKDPRDWRQTFQIYPVGINESVIVDLEMICQCDCERPGNEGYEERSPRCNNVGTYKCGVCECPPDFFGRKCECSAEALPFNSDLEAGCRPDNTTSTLCNNRGDCICGKCECYPRENGDEVVSGDYCECDNFSCDRYNGELCSGPEHGECECGECRCKETEEGQYSGKWCEECPTCPGKCEELKSCVQCQVFQSGELTRVEDGEGGYICTDEAGEPKCEFKSIVVPKAEDMVNADERTCTFIDDDDCRFTFVYGYKNETGELQVWVQETKECPEVVDIMGIVLGVIGAIVAIGLALILMWKVFTSIHDRREFAKFEKERMLAKWDTGENPIFKQATSTFKNPTYAGK